MERADTEGRFELRSTQDSPLFLSWEFDPEVEDLCAGIRSVVEAGGEYTFEPGDERDFMFVVQRKGEVILVRVSVAHHDVPDDLGWTVGLAVDEAELLQFAAGLVAELGPVKGVPQDQ